MWIHAEVKQLLRKRRHRDHKPFRSLWPDSAAIQARRSVTNRSDGTSGGSNFTLVTKASLISGSMNRHRLATVFQASARATRNHFLPGPIAVSHRTARLSSRRAWAKSRADLAKLDGLATPRCIANPVGRTYVRSTFEFDPLHGWLKRLKM